ncbi:hypothetical protein [Caulobacter endophyticus]|uniref:hypothetical protein n=1 Tax=Caulobacter endophyticus TaxID=2172652 RepID=UPI00240F53BA|nr:hypothetical protein [Caulobacter endophyticus]MDG2527832.1 hypothetical protein [Caulobacter endophyticus]
MNATPSSGKSAGMFSPMTVLVLVLVGVLSFTGLAVLSAYAPELRKGDDGGGHALSRSSSGFGAIARLLGLMGEPVLTSRGDLPASAEEGLLVLTPSAGMSPIPLERNDHIGPTLVVLPKWATAPDPKHRGWVTTFGGNEPGQALNVLPPNLRKDLKLKVAEGRRTVRLRRPAGETLGAPVAVQRARTLVGSGWIPVLLDQDGGVVMAMREDSRTYVLADPDYLNTQGLKTAEGALTAVAMLDLIRDEDSPVIFDVTLHGFKRTRSLMRLVLEPPLLGATLVAAALALLAGAQAFARFGPPLRSRRAVALGKAALADNTAGLVRLARREHRMAPLYARLIQASAARAIGAPRGLDGQDLIDFLDRVSRIVGATHTYSALAERALTATPSDLMAVARDLHTWKQELIRGRQ